MNFLVNRKDEIEYKHTNLIIIYVNVMKISLIIMKGDYGAIYSDDSTCHGYYIIRLYLSSYTLKTDLSIDGQVISSGEMV